MKNVMRVGFLKLAVTLVIALIIIAGGVYFYSKKEPIENSQVNQIWSVYDRVVQASENSDLAALNKNRYTQITSKEDIATFGANSKQEAQEIRKYIKKEEFVNFWVGDKQAVFSTAPFPVVGENVHPDYPRYGVNMLVFVRSDNSWKLFRILPLEMWNVSKRNPDGSIKTATEFETEIKRITLDSDQDGLADEEERCVIKRFSECVKTDPNKRDTNGDGWWDVFGDVMTR